MVSGDAALGEIGSCVGRTHSTVGCFGLWCSLNKLLIKKGGGGNRFRFGGGKTRFRFDVVAIS